MASIKEIQDRMKSIRDTLKITNAMYMISSVKLRQSKKALVDTEPFFYTLELEMARIIKNDDELAGEFFRVKDCPPEEKKVAFIVITGDKGLAGAYNHNILKSIETELHKYPNHMIFSLGEVGNHYLESHGYQIERHLSYFGSRPEYTKARDLSEEIIEDYQNGVFDEICLIYTRMVNAMTETVEVKPLLPIRKEDFDPPELKDDPHRNLHFDPGSEEFMNQLIPIYVTGYLYGAFVEADACEHNARMMAMQSASDNAKQMLGDLENQYNRARQTAITQEITEVIAGAKAQKKKRN